MIHPLPFPLIIRTVLLLNIPQERIRTDSVTDGNLQATDNRGYRHRRNAVGSGYEGNK
jgi:hypothetical protein